MTDEEIQEYEALPTLEQKVVWIVNYMRKHNITIDREAVQRLRAEHEAT